jgi:hypothetical protein
VPRRRKTYFPARKTSKDTAPRTPYAHIEPTNLAIALIEREANANVCFLKATLDALERLWLCFCLIFIAIANKMVPTASHADALCKPLLIIR